MESQPRTTYARKVKSQKYCASHARRALIVFFTPPQSAALFPGKYRCHCCYGYRLKAWVSQV